MRLIPFRAAAILMIVFFGAAVVFQVIVLLGFIPTEMDWGGRLQNEQERTVGAVMSMVVLLLCVALVLLRLRRPDSAIGGWGMWIICGLFVLNTSGNLQALDMRETLIFTPVTLILAVLAARVAMGDADRKA